MPLDPDLWFSAVTVRVQQVRKAHKAPCAVCGRVPQTYRLFLGLGAGRGAQTVILCELHGRAHLRRMQQEAGRAIERLAGKGTPIRDTRWYGEILSKRAKEAKARKEAKRAATGKQDGE